MPDDVAHRGVETAGRIDREENERGALVVGLVDAPVDVLGHDGFDFAVDAKLDDQWCRGQGRGLSRRPGRAAEARGEQAEASESSHAASLAHLPPS